MTLSRRTILRGVGTAIALPWLDAMANPTRLIASTTSDTVAKEIPKRVAFAYIPNGVIGSKWFPTQTGRGFELPSSLQPLTKLRDELTIISGLDRTYAAGSDPHAQCGSCWMTSAAHVEGLNPISRTLDQILAASQQGKTTFPSIELSCNSFTDRREPKSFDAISWYGPGHEARSEKNPIQVFRRLFGHTTGVNQSVLDTISGQARSLKSQIGHHDKHRINEYLEAVRAIEQRVQFQAQDKIRLADWNLQEPDKVPSDRGEYIRLMGDLMLLAFQTDSTRVASLMIGPERWAAPQLYPGVFDKPVDHHTMTHDHAYDQQVAQIDRFHMEQFAYLIDKMKTTKEANGKTLLDNCLLVVGSGLGDGAEHSYKELPLLLAGSSSIGIEAGQHIRAEKDTPLANFWLFLANRMGLDLPNFADSTGELKIG